MNLNLEKLAEALIDEADEYTDKYRRAISDHYRCMAGTAAFVLYSLAIAINNSTEEEGAPHDSHSND